MDSLTIAAAIRTHRHPDVIYDSTSAATKSISKAELRLPTTYHRKLRFVRLEEDWVERVKTRYNFESVSMPSALAPGTPPPLVLSEYYVNCAPHSYTETQETTTHMFHRNHILTPAALYAAAYVTGGGTSSGKSYPQAARDAVASLKARPGDRTEESLIYPDHKVTLEVIAGDRWSLDPSPLSKRSSVLLHGEDKTNRVMKKVKPLIDNIVAKQSYSYPTEINGCCAGTRVLTQVYTQMLASRADGDPAGWINKLYASSAVGEHLHCYVKLADNEETMVISKWYTDAESLENTVSILLYSLEQVHTHPTNRELPSSHADLDRISPSLAVNMLQPSAARPSLFGLTAFSIFFHVLHKIVHIARRMLDKIFPSTPPVLEFDPLLSRVLLRRGHIYQAQFDEFVGKGSTGTALRSRTEKKILKFGAPRTILHETLIYNRLAGLENLAVPHHWGPYPLLTPTSEQLAIILDDVGDPIDTGSMTLRQRSDLVRLIHQLHQAGVHHHDVIGNTLVDANGNISLVDFDQAELIPPGASCLCCDDRDTITVLELDDPVFPAA